MTDTNWYLTLRKQDVIGTEEDGKDKAIEYTISKGFTEKQFERSLPIALLQAAVGHLYLEIQQTRGKNG